MSVRGLINQVTRLKVSIFTFLSFPLSDIFKLSIFTQVLD